MYALTPLNTIHRNIRFTVPIAIVIVITKNMRYHSTIGTLNVGTDFVVNQIV